MNKETLQNYNNRLNENNNTIDNINSLIKRLPTGSEDLTEELTTYDTELTEQETSIQDIIKALEGKATGGEGGNTGDESKGYAPRVLKFVSYTGDDLCEDLAYLNTSNMTDMYKMFYNCANLTSLNLQHFDTSNVTTMESMFIQCKALTSLDLSNFDTSNVTNMESMFYYCIGLKKLDIRNFTFTNVTNADYMFNYIPADCEIIVKDDDAREWVKARRSDLTNIRIVSEVVETGYYSSNAGFSYYTGTKLDYEVSNFDVSGRKDLSDIFISCANLTHLDLSKWDTSQATNMDYLFSGCVSLTRLDIRNFTFTNVTSYENTFGWSDSTYVPANCLIIVKDATAKSWLKSKFSRLKNVKTVAELEG